MISAQTPSNRKAALKSWNSQYPLLSGTPSRGRRIIDFANAGPSDRSATRKSALQPTARQIIEPARRRWQFTFTRSDQARHHDLIRSKSDHDLISFPGHDAGSRFALTRGPAHALRDGKLAFLGYSFECFGRALDPVLAIVTIGRKQPNDLIGAACGRTRHVTRSEVNGRPNVEFVLQRPLHHAKSPGRAPRSPLRPPAGTHDLFIARGICQWPVTSGHGKCADLAIF